MKNKKILIPLFILGVLCLLNIFHFWIFVKGISMQPSLHTGDILIVNPFTNEASIGDLIVFNRGNDTFIKRVKYDTGYYYSSSTSVNDDVNLYTYVSNKQYTKLMAGKSVMKKFHYTSLQGNYWVQGDNVNYSQNSDTLGVVKPESVLGRVVYVLKFANIF